MNRKLKIDLAELDLALQNASYEMRFYLDLETGEVILIPAEFFGRLEPIYEEIYDDEGRRTVPLEAYLEEEGRFEWQNEMVLEADRVEQGYGDRYITIEPDDPYADYKDMERFIQTVDDPELRDRLSRAIKRRGAFGNFKDIVYGRSALRERWYAFKSAQQHRRVEEWLENHDIEPLS